MSGPNEDLHENINRRLRISTRGGAALRRTGPDAIHPAAWQPRRWLFRSLITFRWPWSETLEARKRFNGNDRAITCLIERQRGGAEVDSLPLSEEPFRPMETVTGPLQRARGPERHLWDVDTSPEDVIKRDTQTSVRTFDDFIWQVLPEPAR